MPFYAVRCGRKPGVYMTWYLMYLLRAICESAQFAKIRMQQSLERRVFLKLNISLFYLFIICIMPMVHK